jgi:uncharacterized membrane protein
MLSPRPIYDPDRLNAFSDGIFAFAATLLVLQIAVPTAADVKSAGGSLATALSNGNFVPHVVTFALSFFVVSIYRAVHARLFSGILHIDGVIAQLNTVFLLLIAFLPFATSLSSNFNDELAFVLYASTLAAAGFLLLAVSIYASVRTKLVLPERRLSRSGALREAVAPTVFLLSIPISFWNRDVANYSWLLILPAGVLLNRAFPPRWRQHPNAEPADHSDPATRAAADEGEAHPS